jgi:hypothetical protein
MVIIIMVLPSCSNDFNLVKPDDPIPVVYFRMDPADSLFLLTLTKTFSGNGSGYDLANDPDKVYYKDADIRLEGWAKQFKVWETRFNLTENSKIAGTFPEVPGYCYDSPNEFFPLDMYGYLGLNYDEITSFRIVIDLQGKFGPVLASVEFVPLPKRIFPATPLKVLDLFPDGTNYKAGIQVNTKFVKYCELICVFRYQEFTDAWVDRCVTFPLRKDVQIANENAITFIDPELLFTKIALNISKINDSITRKFQSLDLIFYAGDENFKSYNETYINAGNLDSPPMGNIHNGYGMFTMIRSVKIEKNMSMSYRTLDFLSRGKYTSHLGFIRW